MLPDSNTHPPFDFDYNEQVQPEYFDIAGGPFFHGTSRRAARKILKEGLRDWSWTAKDPELRHLLKRGIVRWLHGGQFGRGTYVTRNWRSGLFFGPVLFRVSVQPGTRILRLDVPPDDKVVDSLRREFGKEILTQPPWKVLPRNKHLTLEEAIQPARYHFHGIKNSSTRNNPRAAMHEQRMLDFRKTLVRYGIQGWGEPSSLGGIVIFATDRIQVTEVVLSLPQKDLLWDFNKQRPLPSISAARTRVVTEGRSKTHTRPASAAKNGGPDILVLRTKSGYPSGRGWSSRPPRFPAPIRDV
jgi:hypothetical protein